MGILRVSFWHTIPLPAHTATCVWWQPSQPLNTTVYYPTCGVIHIYRMQNRLMSSWEWQQAIRAVGKDGVHFNIVISLLWLAQTTWQPMWILMNHYENHQSCYPLQPDQLTHLHYFDPPNKSENSPTNLPSPGCPESLMPHLLETLIRCLMFTSLCGLTSHNSFGWTPLWWERCSHLCSTWWEIVERSGWGWVLYVRRVWGE